MLAGNFTQISTFTFHLGIFYMPQNLRHGSDGFTFPPKEGVPEEFFALKNPDSFGRV
jgi:hypothetical protein